MDLDGCDEVKMSILIITIKGTLPFLGVYNDTIGYRTPFTGNLSTNGLRSPGLMVEVRAQLLTVYMPVNEIHILSLGF